MERFFIISYPRVDSVFLCEMRDDVEEVVCFGEAFAQYQDYTMAS